MTDIIRRTVLPAALLLGVSACAPADAGEGGESARAEGGAQAGAVCRIVHRNLPMSGGVAESSGAALSRRHSGVVWTHEDSGRDADLFALRANGSLAGRVRVAGARNRDWEDLALGPCGAGGGDCLYIADTGNNAGNRDHVSLYVVPEPAPAAGRTQPAREHQARFPGRRTPDVEALVVLPGGDVFLVTKGNRDPIEVYRWPTPLRAGGAPVELQRVRQLAPRPPQIGDRATGAAASPDGRWVAVRTYGELAFFRAADFTRSGSTAGPVAEVDLVPLGESQGEGVALGPAGQVLLTTEGESAGSLSWLACALPSSP